MTEKERHLDEALFDIGSDLTHLQEQFGGAFSQEEAEAVVAGFDGNVSRAASLYKNLTDGYVSHLTSEPLTNCGWRDRVQSRLNLKTTL